MRKGNKYMTLSKQVRVVARLALYRYKTALTMGEPEIKAHQIALNSIWFFCDEADHVHRYRAFKRFRKLKEKYNYT